MNSREAILDYPFTEELGTASRELYEFGSFLPVKPFANLTGAGIVTPFAILPTLGSSDMVVVVVSVEFTPSPGRG